MQSFLTYLDKIESKSITLYYFILCLVFPFFLAFFIKGDDSHFLSSLLLISPITMLLVFTASYVCLYMFFENKLGDDFKNLRYVYLLSLPIVAPLIYFIVNVEAVEIINNEFLLDFNVFPNTLQIVQLSVFINLIKNITIFLLITFSIIAFFIAYKNNSLDVEASFKTIKKAFSRFKQIIIISIINVFLITAVSSFMTGSYIIGNIAYFFDGNNNNMCGNLENTGHDRLFYINDNTRGFLHQEIEPIFVSGQKIPNLLETENKIILLDCEIRESFKDNINLPKAYNEKDELTELYHFTKKLLSDNGLLSEDNSGYYHIGVKTENYQVNDNQIINVHTYLSSERGRIKGKILKESYKEYIVNEENNFDEETLSLLEITKMIERIKE